MPSCGGRGATCGPAPLGRACEGTPRGAFWGAPSTTQEVDDELPWLTHRAVDVQTAMHVLARRPRHADEPQLFLNRVDLRRMQLSDAVLSDTHLRHANLASSWIPGTHLERSSMKNVDLRKANLREACLTHADLRDAHRQGADLRWTSLRQADLRGANLTGARLDGADLVGVQADDTTTWPDGWVQQGTEGEGKAIASIVDSTLVPEAGSPTEAPG